VKLGIALGRLDPRHFLECTLEGERLGYESVWLPEHLILPETMSGSPHAGAAHPPIPPTTPVFDAFVQLAFLAAHTRRIRLGTGIFNIGLRHPFVTARAVQTLDLVSGGRAEVGIGAGWLAEEWAATQLDFASRGRRVDECVAVCKRLWSEPRVAHRGEFFAFDEVVFEPKPVQRPWPPLLVGGESDAALRRAVRIGDGWLGMNHDFESGAARIARLRALLGERQRDPAPFQICLGSPSPTRDEVHRWEDLGIDRLVVAPWKRSREALDGLRRLADELGAP